MVACECKEYDMKGIRGRETGQSPFLPKLLRRRHGMASSWRFDAMRIHETPRRGHEGRASGVVFFSTAAHFFWRVVIAVPGCQRRDEVTTRFTHAPIFSAVGGQASSLPRAVEDSSGQVVRRDRWVNLGFYMGWWAYLVLGRVFFTHG